MNRKLRDRSRSPTCSAGHDSSTSSGASKSFSIHAEYKFSVARFQVLRRGQTLPAVVARRRRLVGAHGDFARDRAAPGRRAVARELRVPRARGRRRDLGEPEIGRPAMPVTRAGRDASVRRDQRKLALERLLRDEEDAQGRALPRRDRRRQEPRVRPHLHRRRASLGPVRPLPSQGSRKTHRDQQQCCRVQKQQTGVLETIESPCLSYDANSSITAAPPES